METLTVQSVGSLALSMTGGDTLSLMWTRPSAPKSNLTDFLKLPPAPMRVYICAVAPS